MQCFTVVCVFKLSSISRGHHITLLIAAGSEHHGSDVLFLLLKNLFYHFICYFIACKLNSYYVTLSFALFSLLPCLVVIMPLSPLLLGQHHGSDIFLPVAEKSSLSLHVLVHRLIVT